MCVCVKVNKETIPENGFHDSVKSLQELRGQGAVIPGCCELALTVEHAKEEKKQYLHLYNKILARVAEMRGLCVSPP